MTGQELIASLVDNDIFPGNLDYHYGMSAEAKEFLSSLGERVRVYADGGDEGGGESVERVFHFVEHDVYIRTTGYYTSNEGTDWDSEFTQVFPRRVITIAYESADERGTKTDEA